MKIAICDDERSDSSRIEEFLISYNSDLEYEVFRSAEELLKALEHNFFDLVFLDIEMGQMNGFNAAKQIREGDDKPLIVFTTKSSKYTIQGYEVAFRYLVKPVTYDSFSKVMNAAMEQLVPQKITVEINGKNYLFSTKDIYYFEVLNHNIKIHTLNGIYDIRDSLKNVELMLAGGTFIRPHHSFLVNLQHIMSISQSDIIMKNGQKINISRKKKDDVLKAFHQFLRR
jgi:DNA-binding LytR/AlgR family response regulator